MDFNMVCNFKRAYGESEVLQEAYKCTIPVYLTLNWRGGEFAKLGSSEFAL